MTRYDLPAWTIALVGIICATVLQALNHPIPEILSITIGASVGAAAGIAAPGQTKSGNQVTLS
jgi:hypothetical protein